MIKSGSYRKHYKGTNYKVLTLAVHTETGANMVVYQDISHPEKIWVRPVEMFLEKVMVEGEEVERFSLIVSQ